MPICCQGDWSASWTTFFSGGIIMTASRPLDDVPEFRHWRLAFPGHVASQGNQHGTEHLESQAY
jgi:hypothetical protein